MSEFTRVYKVKDENVNNEKELRNEQIKQKQIIREISQADGLTASLVDLLIEKVYVFPGKRIEIAYKVSEIKNQNFGEITKKR